MSDGEQEVVYKRRIKSLHYGSLQEQEEKRQSRGGGSGSLAGDALEAGIAAGNININKGDI